MSTVVTAMLLIDGEGRLLLSKRVNPPELAGKWELPGGKLQSDETLEECLAREIREELGLSVSIGCVFDVTRNGTSGSDIVIICFRCYCECDHPIDITAGIEGQDVTWIRPTDVPNLDIVPADVRFIDKYVHEYYAHQARRCLCEEDS